MEAECKIEQLASVSKDLDELEESYWHTFNDFSLKTQYHMDDKAALMNTINSTAEKLDSLRQTNVFMDVFRIDHDGPFGTISGFRLFDFCHVLFNCIMFALFVVLDLARLQMWQLIGMKSMQHGVKQCCCFIQWLIFAILHSLIISLFQWGANPRSLKEQDPTVCCYC